MSARESWAKRPAPRPEYEEAAGIGQARATRMNAMDRCDRCGAQAYVRVLLRGGQELMFCAHHYRQHAPALAKFAVAVHDDRQRLVRSEWLGSPS
jgi:hypothetical protein